ncbi:hypothetical protein GCM10009530_59870 [Microbispora corallina]|uniref:Uncharacterized protein n=1 Tax=Microbispora corallina TaxID=83302 RepID=A0ABQ4GAE6_9ACTN|nr:hypothetical protein Mco01_69380 [Microbispora corallina]
MTGVLGRIRATLVSFVTELREVMPPGQETPSAAEADHALDKALPAGVNITAHKGATVNYLLGGAGQSSITNTVGDVGRKSRPVWSVVSWLIATIIALVGTYARLAQWLHWPAPWK